MVYLLVGSGSHFSDKKFFKTLAIGLMGKCMSSSTYGAHEIVLNECLCYLRPADIARLFYALTIKGILPGTYGISKDLKTV